MSGFQKTGFGSTAGGVAAFFLNPKVPAHQVGANAGYLQRIPFSASAILFRVHVPAGLPGQAWLVHAWSLAGAHPDNVALDGTASQLAGAWPLDPGTYEFSRDASDGYDTYLAVQGANGAWVISVLEAA